MNIFLKKLLRGKVVTLLTVLLLAAAIALLSIGFSAWYGTRAQLEQVGGRYTTIAVPVPENFRTSIFYKNGSDVMIPLTQQEQGYPGLLAEDFRGFLTAHVAGCSTLSCYDVGVYKNADFDVYGTAMAVAAAKCVSVRDISTSYERTKRLEDGTAVETKFLDRSYFVEFSLEEMVCRHPAYSELPEAEIIEFASAIYTAEKTIPFEVGKTYLLFGDVCGPLSHRTLYGWEFIAPESSALVVDQTSDSGMTPPRTGNMLFYWQNIETDSESGVTEKYRCLDEDSLPFYAEYTGNWRDFLNTQVGEIWRETLIPLCQINHESAAIVLTDNMESLYQFNTGTASLVEGRHFEAAEYANGEAVCLVSAAYANKNNLSVGDVINLDFYQSQLKYRRFLESPILIHGPCRPDNRLGVQKDYKIVGIYTAPEFEYGQHSFQGDTIFVPKNSVPNSSLYEDPHRALLYSVILENGKAEEFEEYLASMDCGGMFEYFDQGYNLLRDTYTVIESNALRLLALGAAAFLLSAALFVFLNLRRMAPTVQGMRLIGVKSVMVWRELTAALAVSAVGSAVLGGLLGAAVYGLVAEKAVSPSITLHPGSLALCAGAAAAVLVAVSALCVLPVSYQNLMQTPKAGKK